MWAAIPKPMAEQKQRIHSFLMRCFSVEKNSSGSILTSNVQCEVFLQRWGCGLSYKALFKFMITQTEENENI